MISKYLWDCISIQKGLIDFLPEALEAFGGQIFKNQGVYFDFKDFKLNSLLRVGSER